MRGCRQTDTGIGIAKEHQASLFRDFVQVDSPIQKRLRGIGLGLSLSKQLAELLGGSITVESKLGVGSIPSPPQPSAFAAALPNSELSLHGVRVLIVDDDADARKVLIRMLVDFDASVIDAGSVTQALAIVDSFKPHVLVSDIGMPGKDGYDLIRQLRRRTDEYHRLPAIAPDSLFRRGKCGPFNPRGLSNAFDQAGESRNIGGRN